MCRYLRLAVKDWPSRNFLVFIHIVILPTSALKKKKRPANLEYEIRTALQSFLRALLDFGKDKYLWQEAVLFI